MRLIATIATSILLVGCGGSTSGVVGSDNRPPDIAGTPTAITIPENSSSTVVSIVVSDEDPASVVLTLEGPDAARFTLRNRTDLVFASPPDFENARDANFDNVYLVTVVATDNLGSKSRANVQVTVSNVAEAVAVRYLDPLFLQMTTIGNFQLPASSGGTFGVTVLGPMGDTISNRPLVLVASGSFFGPPQIAPEVMARQFVQRGYVVGLIDRNAPTAFLGNPAELAAETARGATDLTAAAEYLSAQASRFGLDGSRILAAGEGTGALIAARANLQSGRPGSGTFRGALTVGGGLLDGSEVGAGSGALYAVHRAGDTRLSCAAGSCAMVRSFTSAGVPAQLLTLGGNRTAFDDAEIDAIFRGATEMFYSQIIAPTG